tara:strand:- start:1552 stop:2127 length:576 start_codon:yes stop_codon:yes gene_type:complete
MNKNIDILYLARNHHKIDQYKLHIENELETNKTFSSDIIKYKSRIVSMNDLLFDTISNNIYDVSDSANTMSTNNISINNSNAKFISFYRNYLISVIEYFKLDDFYKNNQHEICSYINFSNQDSKNPKNNLKRVQKSLVIDLSQNIINDIKLLKNLEIKNDKNKKPLKNFVNINSNSNSKTKILPRKKMYIE